MIRQIDGTSSEGIMMGMDGPSMSGTWVNPKTGDRFTVQECFLQDGNFVVMATNGRTYDYNMIQDYVQESEQAPTPQLAQVASQVSPAKPLGNINSPVQIDPAEILHEFPSLDDLEEPTKTPAMDPDQLMIQKVLDDKPLPEMNAYIAWPGRPQAQLDTLVDVLGVSPDAIAEYYINKLDFDAIKEHMITILGNSIKKPTSELPGETRSDGEPEAPVIGVKVKKTTRKTK